MQSMAALMPANRRARGLMSVATTRVDTLAMSSANTPQPQPRSSSESIFSGQLESGRSIGLGHRDFILRIASASHVVACTSARQSMASRSAGRVFRRNVTTRLRRPPSRKRDQRKAKCEQPEGSGLRNFGRTEGRRRQLPEHAVFVAYNAP